MNIICELEVSPKAGNQITKTPICDANKRESLQLMPCLHSRMIRDQNESVFENGFPVTSGRKMVLLRSSVVSQC